jgi:outer membrane lipoprotein-sorting protein
MIGHSFPALEELAYTPTMLHNRINSIRPFAPWIPLAFLVFAGLFSAVSFSQVPTIPAGPQEAPKTRLPTPAGGAAGPGAAPAAQPEEPPTDAEKVIDGAIKLLAKLQSVTADVVESVDMLYQKFTIKGQYLRAPNARVKLQLTVYGLPDSTGTTLQVCDGETLWEYQQILDRQYYRKLSIKPVLERLNSPDLDPTVRTLAINQMGLAGPETLLVGLRKQMKFDLKEEVVLDGRKVWKLHGTWKNRQGLVADSRPVNPIGVLPPYIPMDVTLFLGKEDGWPYKMILAGRPLSTVFDTRRLGPDGRLQGAKSSIEKIPRTLITLVYSDVKLNSAIRVDRFAFTAPANATVEDSTEALLKGLDRELEREAQKKKSDAAKKDGAIIDQSINLPAPPDAGANP